MNKDRLLKTAEFILTVPSEAFSMLKWGKFTSEFPSCAFAWATQIKEFNKLKMGDCEPIYKQGATWLTGFAAAEAFYEITNSQALYLFSLYKYRGEITQEVVSERIKRFVKSDGAM